LLSASFCEEDFRAYFFAETEAANELVTKAKTSNTNSAMEAKRLFMTTLGLRNTATNQPLSR
jgi:hypothetical protein